MCSIWHPPQVLLTWSWGWDGAVLNGDMFYSYLSHFVRVLVSSVHIHTVNPQQRVPKAGLTTNMPSATFRSHSFVLQCSLRYRSLQGLQVCCQEQSADTLLIGCVPNFGTMKLLLCKPRPCFSAKVALQCRFLSPRSLQHRMWKP